MKRTSIRIVITSVAIAFLLGGCAKDPSKGVAKATVAEAPKAEPKKAEADKAETDKAETDKAETKPAAEAKAAAAKPANTVETEITKQGETVDTTKPGGYLPMTGPAGTAVLGGDIIFVGSKVTGSHACKFGQWSGYAGLNGGDPVGGSLAFRVDMGSIIADFDAPNDWSKKLEGHLKQGDFFAIDRYPTAEFVSTAIKAGAEGTATHTIAGKLTMRGVTKAVTFPATLAVDQAAKTVKGDAEFSINRKDFGIVYPGKPDDLIRDDVVLKIHVTGTIS